MTTPLDDRATPRSLATTQKYTEFEPTLFDSCFYFQFIYEDGNKFLVIVCVYVDNFNIIAEREVDVIHFDKEIRKALETRVEDPNVMLGIVFVETSTSLQLNMRFQVDAILERYKMLDCNIKRTPLPSGVLLGPAVEAKLSRSFLIQS